jgi:hypothetical protein
VDAPSFWLLAPFSCCHGQASGVSISRGRASIFPLTSVTAFPIPLHWHRLRGARFFASTPPASLPPDSGVALVCRAEDGDEGAAPAITDSHSPASRGFACLGRTVPSLLFFPFQADADAQGAPSMSSTSRVLLPSEALRSQFARVYSSGMGGLGAGWTWR